MNEDDPLEVTGAIYFNDVTGSATETQILRTVTAMVDWATADTSHDYTANDELSYPRTAKYCSPKQDLANALGLSGFPVVWNGAIIASHHLEVPDDDFGFHIYVAVRAEDLSWLVRVRYIQHAGKPELNTAKLIQTWGVDYDLAHDWFVNVEKQLANF
jgi:hypothetical protein